MPASTPIPSDLSPHRPYEPRGAALSLLTSRAGEILLSGPAGTGKSRACLEKLHLCALRYPGMRGLILRKTRESLTESALVTWETKVVPERHPCLAGPARPNRRSYRYANGSEIIVSGLKQSGRDQTQKVMSTDYDIIYVQEAIELAEEEWEKATTRLRNGMMPYQQLIADTNPDSPRHWLKRRCDSGGCLLFESRHEDNPVLWARGDWTARGRLYIGRLDALTGHRKLRLRHGRWVQAEGVVYDGWYPAIHLIDRFDIPHDWPRIWSVDFGYTNPFVWQAWALDHDNRLFRYREIYHTRRLVEDHAARILQLNGAAPLPVAIVCDHDAEDRATLERYLGLPTTPALKAVLAGIQGVAARLRPQADGRPRLFLLRDSLDQRDPDLDDRKLPCCTEEEFDGYTWATTGVKESPMKANDHGLDALRYVVWGLDSGEEGPDQQTRFAPV